MHPDQSASRPAVGEHDFRRALGLFATGTTVVTSRDGLDVHAMTANSFTSVSLKPPLVLVCVHQGGLLQRLVQRAGTFAVSVLAANQEATARHFADRRRPAGLAQFAVTNWFPGPLTGAPLLAGCLVWLECTLHDTVACGDNKILVGQVLSTARSDRRDPLLFFASDYRRLEDPQPSTTRRYAECQASSTSSSSHALGKSGTP
jgi:flavin reductase (DIM6/NTAB) family NADH-FMN oxidoreductase RutF